MAKMNQVEVRDGERLIKVLSKCFIIPNNLTAPKDLLIESGRVRRAQYIKDIIDVNRDNPHVKDILDEIDPAASEAVQLWYYTPTCKNLVDHSMTVLDENGNEKLLRPLNIEFLPTEFFKGRKEGDKFILKVPANLYGDKRFNDPEPIYMYLQIILQQAGSRYYWMGTFDEALKKLQEA